MAVREEIIDHFELILHGVQATRRFIERLRCPLQGGTGVRGQFYPHQFQNVQRILSSTQIRHLIADEVGMGKTVQALMVANALRLQRGKLRVRVIVGRSELQGQWIEEIQTRAHTTAEMGREVVGDDWYDVLRDSDITSAATTLNPTTCDLLILDEPQSLRAELLGYIAENSAAYPRLLLLTASPNLRDVRRLCELLQMLEPERIERVRRELYAERVHEDDNWSRTRLRDSGLDVLGEVLQQFREHCRLTGMDELPAGRSPHSTLFSETRKRRLLVDARWMYRNILRSYRNDYSNYLPRRRHKSLQVEPTEAERERRTQAFACVREMTEPARAAAFMRRVVLGGDSLQARLRDIRSDELHLESRFVSIRELAGKQTADARLDALVDWLSRYWRDDPSRKVVIAAQDNPTVDELARELRWRIPEVGPRGKRQPLQILTARDERESEQVPDEPNMESSSPVTALMLSQLREFENESAQLLIAHEEFRQSYNLQAADALVFYSLPWKPEDLDQWIGRVDRLGREYIDPEKRRSHPKPVKIITIHRTGDPTETVESVFHRYELFSSAMDPDRELLEEITSEIHREALTANRLSHQIQASTPAPQPTGSPSDDQQLIRPPDGCRWTVSKARESFEEFIDLPAVEPILRHTNPCGYVCSDEERGLASWIRLLNKQGWINIRKFASKKYTGGNKQRVYYTLSQDKSVRIRLRSLESKKTSHPPFFISRRHIQRPPRLKVSTGEKHDGGSWDSVLQFLSHGSPLHDELVKTFMLAGRFAKTLALELHSLGEQHYSQGTELRPGEYLAGAGFIDPAWIYIDFDPARNLPGGASEEGARLTAMREVEHELFAAAVESDIRFVRMLAPASLSLFALFKTDATWQLCSSRQTADLFSPHWEKTARVNSAELSSQYSGWGEKQGPAFIAKDVRTNWQPLLNPVRELIQERQELIRIEAEDRLWNLQSVQKETQTRIEILEQTPGENNQQTIRLVYRPRLRLLEAQIQIIEAGRDRRCELLDETLQHLRQPGLDSVNMQASFYVSLQPAPVLAGEAETDSDIEDTENLQVEA